MKVVNPKCVQAINEMAHVFMNWPSILEQVQSGGDTICICFDVSCQWLIMKISNPYLVFWTWKTILKSIGVAQLGGRLLNMLATSFSNQWICYSSNKFVALTCDEVVTLDN